MIDYQTALVNTNGIGFPLTLAVNASGGGAQDGTEWVKIFIDDWMGSHQAIMDHAGLTPDSVTEAPGTAQILEAISKGWGIGAGVGVTYWKNGDPSANGDRILLLNGQGVLRVNYANLDAAVYVGDGNNAAVASGGGFFYHADDSLGASPNTVGIYLILPDLRGVTLRGLDAAASIDPDGASRFLGDVQADAAQRVTGAFNTAHHGSTTSFLIAHNGVFTSSSSFSRSLTTVSGNASRESQTDFDNADSTSPNTAKTDDIETRMVNASTRYGITY